METIAESRHPLLERLTELLPGLQLSYSEDTELTLVDRECRVLAVFPGREVASGLKVGDFLPPSAVTRQAFSERQVVTGTRDASAFGFPYRATAIPVFEDGEILGGLAVITSLAVRQAVREVERQLAEHADLLASRTEQTHAAVSHLRSAFEQLATHVGAIRHNMTRAEDQAVSGQQVVSSLTEQSQGMDAAMGTVAHAETALEGQVAAIAKSTTLIQDIARQTNLLALNAAIEAARAGEAGKGFAVVAEEVKKLSEGSRDATRKIEETIRGIAEGLEELKRATGEAGSAQEEGRKVIATVADTYHVIGEAVAEVARALEAMDSRIQSAWAAVEQLTGSVEETAKQAEEVHALAQRLEQLNQNA